MAAATTHSRIGGAHDLIDTLAADLAAVSAYRSRIAVDGLAAAGKTSFGHGLAGALRALGRPTLRASLDDFKHPRSHAAEHGYDRLTGEGYYGNAYDLDSARDLLLVPAGRHGSGVVVLCAHDPLTGGHHRSITVVAPADAVLVVDSVFAFRPEPDDLWDFRIWLEVDPDLALSRVLPADGTSDELCRLVPATPRWAASRCLVGSR